MLGHGILGVSVTLGHAIQGDCGNVTLFYDQSLIVSCWFRGIYYAILCNFVTPSRSFGASLLVVVGTLK